MTGRRIQHDLQRLSGGGSGIRLGRLWTALVVAEVAVTVAMLSPAMRFASEWIRIATTGPGFPAEHYLSASLALEQTQFSPSASEDVRAFESRFTASRAELLRRLASEPGVAAATLASSVPGGEAIGRIQFNSLEVTPSDSGRTTASENGRGFRVRVGNVDESYFTTFGISLIAGRAFRTSDARENMLLVNRAFVATHFLGRSAIGQHVRVVTADPLGQNMVPWLEIIGVVDDVPANPPFDSPRAAIYTMASQPSNPVTLVLRVNGDPTDFAGRLRKIAFAVDPTLIVRGVSRLDAVMREEHLPLRLLTVGLATITLSVLVLAAAGIYALMSVTVTQRRREIGIRMALGASMRTVLSEIFKRASIQLGSGVVLGLGLSVLMNWVTDGDMLSGTGMVILPAVCLFMLGVGTLSALNPARRALNVQPAMVLKSE